MVVAKQLIFSRIKQFRYLKKDKATPLFKRDYKIMTYENTCSNGRNWAA